MSSVGVGVLPDGSNADCEPADAGSLACQARRMLVLAGLITGFWFLANLVGGAHASAAPAPGSATVASSTIDAIASVTAPVRQLATVAEPTRIAAVPSVKATVATTAHAIGPVRHVVANLPTTAPQSVNTIMATERVTTDQIVATTERMSTGPLHVLAPVTRAVRAPAKSIVGSASAASPSAAMQPAGSLRPGIANTAISATTTGASTPATTSDRPSAQHVATSRPAGQQQPTGPPAPLLIRAGGLATSQTSGGSAAATLPSAAIAPSSSSGSAHSANTAAKLRSSSQRPASSPD